MPKDISPPARGFSFKDFSLAKPGQALPGDRLDTELDRVLGKFSDLEQFLLTSFERDGTLKGSTVSQRHLTPAVFDPVMRQISDLIQKTRQDLDLREKSTQNLAVEARNARAEALSAAQEAKDAVQEAKSLNRQAETHAQHANQARARTEAALTPLASLQSDAQTSANSARIAEDMAYRWAEKTDGPVFVPNGADPVDDGFYSSKFWALFTRDTVENGSFWYLGAQDNPPTTNNSGGPLLPGMWYFDTNNGQTFIWDGTFWEPITGAVGTVASVFGRQGAVQAQTNDYAAFYLKLVGGTLTGALTLSASPTALLHASTKGYTDQQDTAFDQAVRAYVNAQDSALNTSLRAYTDAQVATRFPFTGGTVNGPLTVADPNPNLWPLSVFNPLNQSLNGLMLWQPGVTPGSAFFNTSQSTNVVHYGGAGAPRVNLVLSETDLAVFGSGFNNAVVPSAESVLTAARGDARYVQPGDIPPGTHVGDVAPASPAQGQLWFRTLNPVGLFVWHTDADSSQWVSASAGGTPPFASTAEARAGVVADKVMSPALVQALRGEQAIYPAGLLTFVFDQIPNEANDIDLIFNGVGQPANGVIRFDWSGAPAARAYSTRAGLVTGVVPSVVGDDNNTQFVLDQTNTAWAVAGLIMLRRAGGRGGAWAVSGSLRRATTIMLLPTGMFNMNGEANAFLRFNSNLAFTAGLLTARWRI